MFKLPQMFLIGAAGRNVGKTEFACAVIRANNKQPLIALKVTVIKNNDGNCPRGGKGCGVCSSLKTDYKITKEELTPLNKNKDTGRMKLAGAEEVYWIRVKEDSLEAAFEDFMFQIGNDKVIVCESNSLRKMVEPGYFVVIKEKNREQIKTSCQEVISYADWIVESDGSIFSESPADFIFNCTSWQKRYAACALILAGGKSIRMGEDKSFLMLKGKLMLELIAEKLEQMFAQVLVSVSSEKDYRFLNLPLIEDEIENCGPLAGMISGFKFSKYERIFVCTCDTPEIDSSLLKKMFFLTENYDAVLPRTETGFIEPLFAVYKKKLVKIFSKDFVAGERSVQKILKKIKTGYVAVEDNKIINLNTKEDYEKYQK